ncbi:hypothetical protein BOX37_22160 [Nocardia mangyaensis]|uniref:Uncharacterized protein n=1 Tax=Nocardia mangyaensis TaxID=2213200 RepID=A0A1J0VVX4_9NOCA|nr:hypothetical protein [Nocardia mangyaensis]APE36182.1 hypothetical protein BOX37_22160 [Nocardia mangyaensis]
MSTKTPARHALARIAMAGTIAAIPLALAVTPAAAQPSTPSATEIRNDMWDRRDCRHYPWNSRNKWDDRCDRWRGHHPSNPSPWRPFLSGSFGSS